jgi:polyferredoxin
VILLGLQFHVFVLSLADASGMTAPRPPAVEAFLPISSLMSLVYLLKTGDVNPVHPAGLVMFSLFLVLSCLLGRGFCSWICPVGTIAEYAHKAGRRLFGGNLTPPRWLDYILRTPKHLILGFFLCFILPMPGDGLRAFIYSPYNMMADVKMYLFFADISGTAAAVIALLLLFSVLIKNFWCRYLCPYGALLCLFSYFSPVAVRREKTGCTSCGACTRACPNRIAVEEKEVVRSMECTVCFSCVDACPTPDTIGVGTAHSRRALSPTAYGIVLAAAVFLTSQIAAAFNCWHSSIPPGAYRNLYEGIKQMQHPDYYNGENPEAP